MKKGNTNIVLAYFGALLAVAIPFWVLGSVTHVDGLPFGMQLNALVVIAMPLVSAAFIARTHGVSALRVVLRDCLPGRRASSLGLATAFLVPPITAMLAFAITHLFAAFDGWSVSLLLLPAYFAVYYLAAACEEIGWTWFATPLLGKKMSVVSTGVVIGAVWAAMHALPWFQQGGIGFMAGMIVFSIMSRIVMAWLYLNNGQLLWLNIVYHAMINTVFTAFYAGSPYANPTIYAIILVPVISVIWSGTRKT